MVSRIGLLALIALTCALGCGREPDQLPQGTLEFVAPDGRVIRSINIEIAANQASRQKGLMNRRQLPLDQGMLFVFPSLDSLSFWMTNTYIPLDIMFVGADSSIINIARRTTPLSSEHMEVRGGFSKRFGIDESTKIRWHQDNL